MGIAERKEREFQRREDEILTAARRLLSRDDWRSVTIEEIAQAAEIGKGTVYKHFPSKEDLYARLACDFRSGLLARLRKIPASLPVMERLRLMIHTFWAHHFEQGRSQHLIHYCERQDFLNHITEESRSRILELDQALGALLEDVVRQGQEEGVIDPGKPVGLTLFGPHAALAGAVRLVQSGRAAPADPEACLAEITAFILAGLAGGRRASHPN